MAVLLILGNGFDLHCGLKTHFSDFLDEELKKAENILLSNHLAEYIKTFASFISYSGPEYFSSEDFSSSISLWEVFFYALKFCVESKDDHGFSYPADWKDVEKAIRVSLMGEKGALVNWRRVFMLLYKRNKNIMFLDNPPSFDGAVEWILADFIDQFSRFPKNAFVSGSTEEAENIFYVFLFGELKRFEKDFGRYVERQVAENPKYENEACLFANRLCEGSDFVVESFNYTAPNLHCVSFRNVHGTTTNPVIGIDVANIAPKDPRYRFTKASRCLSLAIEDTRLTKPDYNTITDIVIYGHSLNEQDFSYFFNVLETKRIQDPGNICGISFAYSVYDGTTKEREQQKLHDSVAGLLNSYDLWTNHSLTTVESLYLQKKFHFPEVD